MPARRRRPSSSTCAHGGDREPASLPHRCFSEMGDDDAAGHRLMPARARASSVEFLPARWHGSAPSPAADVVCLVFFSFGKAGAVFHSSLITNHPCSCKKQHHAVWALSTFVAPVIQQWRPSGFCTWQRRSMSPSFITGSGKRQTLEKKKRKRSIRQILLFTRAAIIGGSSLASALKALIGLRVLPAGLATGCRCSPPLSPVGGEPCCRIDITACHTHVG